MRHWVFIKDCVDIYTDCVFAVGMFFYRVHNMLMNHSNRLVKKYLPDEYEIPIEAE